MKIPRIIHQTWKTHELPARWKRLPQTWRENHPDWEYRFTTDEDNRKFFVDFYPWFLPIYDAYALDICRAEAFRYFTVYHYGGVYVDLDFESYRPLDGLLLDHELVLAPEPAAHATLSPARERGFDKIICNSFLASIPKHPFWEHVQRLMAEHRNEASFLDSTSTFLLTRACTSYPHTSDLTLAPSEMLYPINFEQAREYYDPKELRARFTSRSYAIHYWHGSWWRDAILESTRRRVKNNPKKKEGQPN